MKNYRIRKLTTTTGKECFFVEKRFWNLFFGIPYWFTWKEVLCDLIQPFRNLEEAEERFNRIEVILKSEVIRSK